MSIPRKDRLKFKHLFQNENTITLKQVYQRAKIVNPLYKKRRFTDFISDFGNSGDEFFSSFKVYLDFMQKRSRLGKILQKILQLK